jgi:hypothetical protein
MREQPPPIRGPDDAFPYFDELIAAQRIRPQEDDYEALFLERDERFADLVYRDAQALLAEAQRNPGEERSGIVGGEATVGVAVDIVETLSETYVAFFIAEVGYERFVLLLASFYPGSHFTDWLDCDRIGGRKLREGETCYRILHSSD